jgi:hypothetical protein
MWSSLPSLLASCGRNNLYLDTVDVVGSTGGWASLLRTSV